MAYYRLIFTERKKDMLASHTLHTKALTAKKAWKELRAELYNYFPDGIYTLCSIKKISKKDYVKEARSSGSRRII